jgi:hypothetical protein
MIKHFGEGIAQAVQSKFEAAGGTVTGFEGITRGDNRFLGSRFTMLEGNPAAINGEVWMLKVLLLVNQCVLRFEGVFFGPDGIKSVRPSGSIRRRC